MVGDAGGNGVAHQVQNNTTYSTVEDAGPPPVISTGTGPAWPGSNIPSMPKVSHQISIPGLELNRASKIPAYKQVYTLLRTAILERRLQPGQRLPSSRLLAESMGLSR